MLEQYKKEIDNFLIKGRLDKAIKRLCEILEDGSLRSEVTLNSSKLNTIEREKRQEILNNENYTTSWSRIHTAISTIKRELTNSDLKDGIKLKETCVERFCVVAESESEHEKDFKKLLNSNYFTNVTYCNYEQVNELDSNLIDIYVFDYEEGQEDLLKTLLKKQDGPPVLIFIRGQLRWLFEPEYKDRYATANSIFTFHSRLNEILETLKWLERS